MYIDKYIYNRLNLVFPYSVHYKKISFLLLFLLGFCIKGVAQRYNFEQYDIEDGLSQSQVTSIVQDSKRRLWVTTLGGISCFNGKQFTSYSKTNGLNSNFTLSLAVNRKNDLLFIGSARGISKYDGQSFYNYPNSDRWVNRLATDKKGTTYALNGKRLFKVNERNFEMIAVTPDTAETLTTIKTDATGKVWAAVYTKGLYYLENNKWIALQLDNTITDLIVTNILIDSFNKNKIWLLTTDGVYIAQNKTLSRVLPQIEIKCMSIEQDHKGNIWIGTNRGAYYVTPERVIHFNSKNGFTDNVVNEIFRDAENNIWLGTDGSGIYKFNDSYVTFDETQGLNSKIVMTIAKGPGPGEIWMGSYSGIFVYKNKLVSKVTIPSRNETSSHINFLYADHKKNIWIGTPGGGLWMYNGKQIEQIDKGYRSIAYNAIIEDSSNNIWLSTNYGCFQYEESSKKLIRITTQFGGGLLEMGRDSIIMGSQDGAYLITEKKNARRLNIGGVNGSSILCMLKVREYIIFGTADYGIFIWNSKTGTTRNISSKTGLVSDHIYSLLKDSRGIIWVGTGRGINKLSSADFNIIKNTDENDLLVECNQNAMIETNGCIWIGTTKGALVYRVNPVAASKINPYIYISSVNVPAGNYKGKDLNKQLILPYKNNSITVNYTGIYLSNPAAVMYRYRLIGMDSNYSQPSSNSSMNFTSIPPGKYTFQVKAVTKHGLISVNTASFSFEILPPYYQTTLFKFFTVFLIIILIMLTVYIILTLNERKRKLRLRIKLEEQFKIRKQTAEDFHDDLGNKLTRITVLSEVLSSMINKDDTEKRAILTKISKNVDELYIGTRDILWSLNPKNDTLSQLLNHIKDFGNEMFNETAISFKVDIDTAGKDSKLSLDMSRNILMIFKESIHNALKHANAHHVTFSTRLNNGLLLITLEDDGPGFDTEYAKNGHGINNMYVRAKRIRADLNITSGSSGTAICLTVNFSTLKHFKNV